MDDSGKSDLEVLSHSGNSTIDRRGFLAGLGAALTCTFAWGAAGAGCATLRPPVDFSAVPKKQPDEAPPLHIKAVEGRRQGFLMRLHALRPPPAGSRLLLRRRLADAPPELIRRVQLDDDLAARLTDPDQGLPFLDRALADLPPDTVVRYRLDLEDGPRSPVLTLTWPRAPKMPDRVWAHQDVQRAVELRWKPAEHDAEHDAAVIFRRDVIANQERTERLAVVGPDSQGSEGVYLDRDVEEGGVYAYQVALGTEIDRRDGEAERAGSEPVYRWGAASEALYVAIDGGSER